MTYKTELEARLHYVAKFMRYTGIKEGGAEHKELVEDYNRIRPLPRGYAAKMSDDWCALSLCGQGYELGYRSWPYECSCPRIADAAKKAGIWRKAGQVPEIGEWILYDWEPNGSPNHIGVVAWVEGSEIWASEGNFSNSHRIRRLAISDGRIYGYVMLDYAELVEQPAPAEKEELTMETTVFHTIEEVPAWGRATVEKLTARGALEGVGGGDLGLSMDLLRMLVINDRCGLYDGLK